jgi:hypothetical protein
VREDGKGIGVYEKGGCGLGEDGLDEGGGTGRYREAGAEDDGIDVFDGFEDGWESVGGK